MIKVQNPWGVEMYKGAWSDDSELWTDELRAEINFTNSRNDGFFWMAFEDYMKFFSTSYTQWDTTNWFSDHFLML